MKVSYRTCDNSLMYFFSFRTAEQRSTIELFMIFLLFVIIQKPSIDVEFS